MGHPYCMETVQFLQDAIAVYHCHKNSQNKIIYAWDLGCLADMGFSGGAGMVFSEGSS